MRESTAALHPRHGVRARVPRRRSTNRRRHCIYARAYVHQYPGVGPRIGGVTASTPRRACTSTLAEVHGCPACVHGRLAVAQERRSRVSGDPRTSEALRTSFEKSTSAMAKALFSRPPI